MFRQIVLALLVFIVIAMIALWVASAGPRRTFESIKNISLPAPLSPSQATGFKLPWQPAVLFPTIDISKALQLDAEATLSESDAERQLIELEAEYDRLSLEAGRSKTFGNPSPYAGTIRFTPDSTGVRSDVEQEHIQIRADVKSAPVSISGWTLESALSGTRIVIPLGASPFIMGAPNAVSNIILEPGGIALLASVPSPVGVSFEENTCTGYLSQFQSFSPALAEECPSPSAALPLTEENIRLYGDGCFDLLPSIPACRFPQGIPDTVYASCRSYLMDSLSYNGCVNREGFRSSFKKNMWRVYLGSTHELWRNTHDAVRLLDSEGRTVDVLVY